MIKGHTKIELKDEVTGEAKTVEQDNMLTNALAELAKPLGRSNGLYSHLYLSSPYNVVETLFGGVMLFAEPLNSDPDDYIWPFANPCTGFASNIAYSGVNTKMGGYNLAESGLQEDGSYKHVWDFATDSGNGTISSLGLTSAYSARIGLGSLMYDFGAGYPKGVFCSRDVSTSAFLTAEHGFLDLFIKDGFLYWVPTSTFDDSVNSVYRNGGIFAIKKTRVPVGAVGLTTAYHEMASETIEIQLPSDFTSQFSSTSLSHYVMSVEHKGGIITLMYLSHSSSGSFPAGDTRKLCHIDCNDNFSTYTTTFTNTTGEAIPQYSSCAYKNFKATRDFCLAKGSSTGCLYVINTNDCTDVKRVRLLNGENFVFPSACYPKGTLYEDEEYAVVIVGPPSDSSDNRFGLFINLKNGEASYANIVDNATFGSGFNAFDERKMLGVSSSTSTGNLNHGCCINPFFLTTKNNLSEPVTKTATQSMKITYTLREG